MQTNLAENYSSCAEEIIERLRNGEEHLRGYLIESYYGFIMSAVSKTTGKNQKYTDEFSIALQAFNEAIDCYDSKHNVSFVSFSSTVINRRLIDYIRKNSKYNSEYPFTYFEVNENQDYVESLSVQQPSVFTQKVEIEEEIEQFKKNLASYSITLDDLIRKAPKHIDTKIMCISIAKKLVESDDLAQKLERTKRLPISEILSVFNLNRKTLDNQRKFIIALYLILKSDMDIIKGYISFLTKGV